MCSISGRSWTCDWITGYKVVRVWSWCILYGGWGKCYILNIPGPPLCCRETVAKGRVTLIFFQNCSNIFKNTWKYSKISQIIWLISLKITQNSQCANVTYLIRNLGVIIQHPDQCYSTQVKADRHCTEDFVAPVRWVSERSHPKRLQACRDPVLVVSAVFFPSTNSSTVLSIIYFFTTVPGRRAPITWIFMLDYCYRYPKKSLDFVF